MATIAITITVGQVTRARTFTVSNVQFQNLVDWIKDDFKRNLPQNPSNQDAIDFWISNFIDDARVKERNSRIKRAVNDLVAATPAIDVT